MKNLVFVFTLLITSHLAVFSQNTKPTPEQILTRLSADKWQWMADKDVDKLAELFDEQSKFVHHGGTWKKERELEVIKSGSIWYKRADVHDVAVEIAGKTAIVWSRISMVAIVGTQEVISEFTVTEVYQKPKKEWKLLNLTFSSVRDTHAIEH